MSEYIAILVADEELIIIIFTLFTTVCRCKTSLLLFTAQSRIRSSRVMNTFLFLVCVSLSGLTSANNPLEKIRIRYSEVPRQCSFYIHVLGIPKGRNETCDPRALLVHIARRLVRAQDCSCPFSAKAVEILMQSSILGAREH